MSKKEQGMERALQIFICEDDPDDRLFLKRAFSGVVPDNRLRFAHDGESVLRMLDEQHPNLGSPLVILDFNMPRMSGREVLSKIRRHDVHPLAPVVVLSTSDAPEDINQAYALGANTYFTKPLEFKALVDLAKNLVIYWQRWALIARAGDGIRY